MITTIAAATPAPVLGIIGGGFMARVHAAAARSAGGDVRGIATSRPETAVAAAEQLRVPRAYSRAEDLIDSDEIETIHICTSNASHEQYAALAVERGKNVICEKPLATSATSARSLMERAEGAVVAAVPFVYRYHPLVREARARVRRGDLGRLFTVRGAYLQDWLWSEDVNDWRVDAAQGGPSRAFADIGSHLCDLLEFITDDRISRISARTSTVHPQRGSLNVSTEDVVALAFETAGKAIGTLLVSQVSAGRKNHLTIDVSGERESVAFDQENPELLWVGQRDGFRAVPRETEFLDAAAAKYSKVPAGHPMGYQDAFNSFVSDVYRSVQGEKVDGLPTFADGYRAATLTEAVLESSRTSAWVETPHLRELGGVTS